MKVRLDINSVAVKQLESAIWMYAYDYDEVAVHTVAGAAFEIYTKRLALSTFIKDVEQYIKPEKRKDFISLVNRPYNFFKHGEHKHQKLEYIEYDEEAVELIIYLAAEANLLADEKFRLSCADIFRKFYILAHPEQFNFKDYDELVVNPIIELGLDPGAIKDKKTLRFWLDTIGNTFLNGTGSPFRNVTRK